MSVRLRDVVVVLSTAAVVAIFMLSITQTAGQAPAGFRASRTADGHPDLNGVCKPSIRRTGISRLTV